MLILPAIDLRGGKCVRLFQGDYAQETVYGDDPVAVARGFEQAGAKILHVVDLDGAKSGIPENLESVRRVCAGTGMRVEVGGGVRTLETAHRILDAGAARVIVGTRIVQDEDAAAMFFSELGERVVAGIDLRDGQVAVHGWTADSGLAGVDFALRMQALGCSRVIVTDVATDGALTGPNLLLMRQMVEALDIPVIASGGVSVLEDLLALKETHVEGAIVGKALYENRFTLEEAVRLLG